MFQSATHRCSLLLVDRTLDLFGPASHESETLADRILSILSYPIQTNSDVCIDMSPVIGGEDIRGGRLAQPRDDKAQQLLKSLVYSKQKVSFLDNTRTHTHAHTLNASRYTRDLL